jgi:hypothetical protein
MGPKLVFDDPEQRTARKKLGRSGSASVFRQFTGATGSASSLVSQYSGYNGTRQSSAGAAATQEGTLLPSISTSSLDAKRAAKAERNAERASKKDTEKPKKTHHHHHGPPEPKGRYDLMLHPDLPEHQVRVLQRGTGVNTQNYMPDPETGFARWPIPGMQGSRQPWNRTPFGEEDWDKETTADRWLTTKNEKERHGIAIDGRPDWRKKYRQGWSGEFEPDDLERVQRCYEESAMMTIAAPGQTGTNKNVFDAKDICL